MDISIVIPLKNAGLKIKTVLDAIFAQKTNMSYEVICVDSGSSDETLSIVQNYKKVNLYCIDPIQFGHGRTRNYGASLGTGDYIVFITQDAIPASETWLNELVNSLKNDKKAAGAFGVHYPYPDCNIFDKRDIINHFLRFGDSNTSFYIQDYHRYENEEPYRLFLNFYSDNNSCMRRSVWEQIPYDDVDFAEDQLWAAKVLLLGYHKVYCPYAPVYHSHNYSISTFFTRYYDEFKNLYKIQKFKLVPSFIMLFPAIMRNIYYDFRYINTLNLRFNEKLYWAFYSIAKNNCRYFAGWLGANYHLLPKSLKFALDNLFSQQIKQTKK